MHIVESIIILNNQRADTTEWRDMWFMHDNVLLKPILLMHTGDINANFGITKIEWLPCQPAGSVG